MIQDFPSPCPILQEGRAIGAEENTGFVAVWNWIAGFFQTIKDNIVTGINNRKGDIYIVAGEGIDVDVSDNTIKISLGDGTTTDDGDDDDEHNGGGAGDENSNGNGSGDGDGDWYPPESLNDDGGISTIGNSSSGMFKWDEENGTMGPGGCMVGRKFYVADGTGAKGDGFYSLKVTITSTGSTSCTVVSDASLGQSPTATECWIPIYQIYDGKVSTDYRGAFVVPAYE